MALEPRIEITIHFFGDGGDAAMILHYTANGYPTSQDEAQQAADSYAGQAAPLLKACLASDCSYEGVTFRVVNGDNSFTAESEEGRGDGTVAGDSLPFESAVVIRKLGNGPARRARGRNFFPGVPESFTNSSYVTDAAKSVYGQWVQFAYETLNLNDTPLTPVVMSRVANQLYQVQGGHIDTVLGHQSRRRPFR